MNKHVRILHAIFGQLSVFMFLVAFEPAVFSQSIGLDRERGAYMLQSIKNDIKRNYYDPQFHGIDLDTHFKTAEAKIKQATSNGQIFGIIAQTLLDFDDSHTFFLPPGRAARTEYGWQMSMVGDKCFVLAVKPKSDADKKGLQPGDQILSIDGYEPMRDNLWKIQYAYYTLRPRPGMKLEILSATDGKQKQLEVMAKVQPLKRVMDLTGEDIGELERESETESRLSRQRYVELGDTFIWKMPQFDLSDSQVDEMMSKVVKRKSLILDLRGNGGGLVSMLQRLAGYFFEEDTKIGDPKGRKEMKPLIAKGRGKNAFKGQLVVLIDSRSGSASELFARIIQLGKKGTVIGDRSSGAVMMSRIYDHELGQDTVVLYAANITAADIIMSDGKSLERVGVIPDELLVPTPGDMAAGRDPVLTRAAVIVGADLPAEKAGALFPIEWRP